jgi:hypothetical protein
MTSIVNLSVKNFGDDEFRGGSTHSGIVLGVDSSNIET